MNLSEFLASAPLTTDLVPVWKQRGVPSFDADKISAKLKFLREHVAEYATANNLDLSTPVVSVSREKIGDYGLGELLVLSTGHRLAAAACEFRVLEEPLASLAVPEKPIAEAAAPRRDSKGRFVKKAAAKKPAKRESFSGIIDYSPAEVDEAIAAFLG